MKIYLSPSVCTSCIPRCTITRWSPLICKWLKVDGVTDIIISKSYLLLLLAKHAVKNVLMLTKKYISTGRNIIIHTEMMTTASIAASRIFFLSIVITESATLTLCWKCAANAGTQVTLKTYTTVYCLNYPSAGNTLV